MLSAGAVFSQASPDALASANTAAVSELPEVPVTDKSSAGVQGANVARHPADPSDPLAMEDFRKKGRLGPIERYRSEVQFNFLSPSGSDKVNWKSEIYKVLAGQELCTLEVKITSQRGKPDASLVARDAQPGSWMVNVTARDPYTVSAVIGTRGESMPTAERTWVKGAIIWSTITRGTPEEFRAKSGCSAASAFHATKACQCSLKSAERSLMRHCLLKPTTQGLLEGEAVSCNAVLRFRGVAFCAPAAAECPDNCVSRLERQDVVLDSPVCAAGKFPFWYEEPRLPEVLPIIGKTRDGRDLQDCMAAVKSYQAPERGTVPAQFKAVRSGLIVSGELGVLDGDYALFTPQGAVNSDGLASDIAWSAVRISLGGDRYIDPAECARAPR